MVKCFPHKHKVPVFNPHAPAFKKYVPVISALRRRRQEDPEACGLASLAESISSRFSESAVERKTSEVHLWPPCAWSHTQCSPHRETRTEQAAQKIDVIARNPSALKAEPGRSQFTCQPVREEQA